MPGQYLESIDSIRAPWAEQADRDSSDLQILLEMTFTLALGRDVIVPQAYALDSLGFLRAASAVLDARDKAGVADRPFRLHLFNADSFDDAARQVLARVGDPHKPFYCSLFPELHDPNVYRPAKARKRSKPLDLEWLLNRDWVGETRTELLRMSWREFSGRPAVKTRANGPGVSLVGVLDDFMDAPIPSHYSKTDDAEFRDVWKELKSAVKSLHPREGGALAQRSNLYLPTPWPGDKKRRTAEEILGSPDRLRLVREFVDTIYNRMVADSIDEPLTASFTTDLVRANVDLGRVGAAQRIALLSYARSTSSASLARAAETSSGFQIVVRAPAAGDKSFLRQLKADLVAGLPALMKARGESAQDSDFWQGVDNYQSARRDGRPSQARAELQKHFDHVVRLMGSDIKAAPTPLLTGLGVPAAVGGVTTGGAEVYWDTGLGQGVSTAFGIVATYCILREGQRAVDAYRQWTRTRRLVRALNDNIEI